MIRRELAIFLIVGSLTVLVDFALYHALLAWTPWPVGSAKAVSFLAGTIFAYVANRFWTFGHQQADHHSLWRFGLLYGATLAVNVGVNAAALRMLPTATLGMHPAFLLATVCSAALNFLGMKFLVFTPATPSSEAA